MEGEANRADTAVVKLVKQLCIKITGFKDDAVLPHFTCALVTLGGNMDISRNTDEFDLAEKIKKKFVRHKREKDAVLFTELHRKLCSQVLLKERSSVVCLLYALSEASGTSKSEGANRYRGVSMPSSILSAQLALSAVTTPSVMSFSSASILGAQSSGFSSVPGSYQSRDPSPMPQSLPPSALHTPFAHHGLQPVNDRTVPSLGLRLLKTVDKSEPSSIASHSNTTMPLSQSMSSRYAGDHMSDVPDVTILKEVIFAFQGIEGKFIKYDAARDAFSVDTKIGVSKPVRKMVNKLAECGLLFSKIRKFADVHSVDRAFGLVGQSFCSALHQELTEYYRLIAVLSAQVQQEEDQGVVCAVGGGLTLRRLVVWMCEPLVRLKTLAALVEVCEGKKGGALASTVHSYMNHGDPAVQTLVRHLLSVVVQPIFTTILRWIYEGELEDTYQEFFVASDAQVKDDRLWHDKYSLRSEMVPSFLSIEQAKKKKVPTATLR